MIRIVSFSEYSDGYYPRVAYDEMVSFEKQLSSAIAVPTIEVGEIKLLLLLTQLPIL